MSSNKSENPDTADAIVHGTGTEKVDHPKHADKVAPMPEIEKGEAIPGMNASGGGSSGISSGPDAGQGSHATKN